MKYLNFFAATLFVALLGFSFASCDPGEETPELKVSNATINVPVEGITESIGITCNTDWNVSGFPAWVKVTPLSGRKNANISLSVDRNNSVGARECIIKVTTVDGDLSEEIHVEQDGADVELSVDLHEVALGATAESSQEITIMCNTTWSIIGLPEWLSASAKSGNGTTVVKLTALATNNSASERSADFTIKANQEKEVEVTVKQRGALAAVTVVPKDITPLYDELCYEYAATGNIAYFYEEILSETEINRMTENAIVSQLMSTKQLSYSDGYISFPNDLTPNTTYYICTVAFDQNDKRGELVKTKVKTPEFKDVNNDAYATCTYNYDGLYLNFNVKKQGQCYKYHLIYGTDLSVAQVGYPRSLYAFQINYYLKYGESHWFAEQCDLEIITNYLNDHSFPTVHFGYDPYTYALIYTWGIFENGETSSDVMGGYVNVSNDDYSAVHKVATRSTSAAVKELKLSDVRKNNKRIQK